MQGKEFAHTKPSIGAVRKGPKLEIVNKKEGTGSPEPAQRMRSDGTKLFHALKQSFLEFGEDDCVTMAASLSFYAIFSLPPLLFMTIAAASYLFGQHSVEGHVLAQVRVLIGVGAAAEVRAMLQAVREQVSDGGVALMVTVGALLFAATGAFVQLQTALNRAWNVRPHTEADAVRDVVMKRLVSFVAVAAVAVLLLITLLVSAGLSAVGAAVFGLLPRQASQGLLRAAELGVSLLLLTGVFAGMFRFLPDARISWRDVWLGGFFTALLFTAGKFALGLYLGELNVVANFGAAGSLAIIMLWVYYASMILLLGAEFTQVWARQRGEPIRPQPGSERYGYEPIEHPE